MVWLLICKSAYKFTEFSNKFSSNHRTGSPTEWELFHAHFLQSTHKRHTKAKQSLIFLRNKTPHKHKFGKKLLFCPFFALYGTLFLLTWLRRSASTVTDGSVGADLTTVTTRHFCADSAKIPENAWWAGPQCLRILTGRCHLLLLVIRAGCVRTTATIVVRLDHVHNTMSATDVFSVTSTN